MKHEAFTCDAKGHDKIQAIHHVTLDGPESRTLDLCDQCMALGLRILLDDISQAAQADWAATVLGEA